MHSTADRKVDFATSSFSFVVMLCVLVRLCAQHWIVYARRLTWTYFYSVVVVVVAVFDYLFAPIISYIFFSSSCISFTHSFIRWRSSLIEMRTRTNLACFYPIFGHSKCYTKCFVIHFVGLIELTAYWWKLFMDYFIDEYMAFQWRVVYSTHIA